MAYSTMDLTRFEIELNKLLKGIPKYANEVKKEVARQCFTQIVNHEPPPIDTGSYISSHRIGIGEPDDSDIVIPKKRKIGVAAARQIAMTQLQKIDLAREGEPIHISNSVGASKGYDWAHHVEYAGWKTKGPYMVYAHAALWIETQVKRIAGEVAAEMDEFN